MNDFTEEEIKRIGSLAAATWDYIGADALRCLEENGEKPVMPRSHVIEMVLDASYMETYFGKKPEDKALLERFRKQDYKDMIKMVKPAFPFARYGW
jgi:hypothetical protein